MTALQLICVPSRVLQNDIYKPRKQEAGDVACMEMDIDAHKTLVDKSEERRHLGKPQRRSDDNIETVLEYTLWEGLAT